MTERGETIEPVNMDDEKQLFMLMTPDFRIVKAKVKKCAKHRNLVIEVPPEANWIMDCMEAEVFVGRDTEGKPYIRYGRFKFKC